MSFLFLLLLELLRIRGSNIRVTIEAFLKMGEDVQSGGKNLRNAKDKAVQVDHKCKKINKKTTTGKMRKIESKNQMLEEPPLQIYYISPNHMITLDHPCMQPV